ncbi:hypothetical protein KR49_11700 [Synechococcus sp. KORDI-49]|nr:hypothetical protein KR49_11700 [Synechococcus sp. KORDI-49]
MIGMVLFFCFFSDPAVPAGFLHFANLMASLSLDQRSGDLR